MKYRNSQAKYRCRRRWSQCTSFWLWLATMQRDALLNGCINVLSSGRCKRAVVIRELEARSTLRDEDWEVKSMRRFAQATMYFSRAHRCVGELFFYFSLIELLKSMGDALRPRSMWATRPVPAQIYRANIRTCSINFRLTNRAHVIYYLKINNNCIYINISIHIYTIYNYHSKIWITD